MTINYQRLRHLGSTVLLEILFILLPMLFAFVLNGGVDLEAVATTPDGHILLLKEIERENASDLKYLYVCRDLEGEILQLSCDSNLELPRH